MVILPKICGIKCDFVEELFICQYYTNKSREYLQQAYSIAMAIQFI